MAGKLVSIKTQVELAMPIAELWQAISNTDRMNKAVGIPIIRFTPQDNDAGVVTQLQAKTNFLGFPVDWDEKPFEWTEQQYFWVERVFKGLVGVFIRSLVVGARLEPLTADKSTVTVFGDFAVQNLIGGLIARLLIGKIFLRRTITAYRNFEREYENRMPILNPTHAKPRLNTRRLHTFTTMLRRFPVKPELVDYLVRHLSTAPDDAVVEMRPFALADDWRTDRMETLRLFLYATRAGLLDLSWQVLCPNCRVAKANYTTLSQLKPEAHCDTCNIRYDVNFDEYVELRFAVNPQIRSGESSTYCIGGPFRSRHIIAQARLAPSESKSLHPVLNVGRYRLRTRQLAGYITLQSSTDAPSSTLAFDFTREPLIGNVATIAPHTATLELTNTSDQELLVLLERESWDDKGVSAALATSLPEFRAAFSSEVLAPGLSIAVRSLTFLFTDLKDSTSLYQRSGDSPAYARVRNHFDLLSDAITQREGSLVKTMGDAIMAVFAKPEQAVAAALAIQQAIVTANAANPAATEQFCVKLGLHTGPCLAVNANDTLDYFGTTVNIAARVQNTSLGGDLVLTEAVLNNVEVRDLLADLPIELFTAQLKGLSEQIPLYRIQPVV